LAQELDRAHRLGHPLSVLYIDIDDFKVANDRFGHASGYRLLRSVALEVSRNVRGADGFGRLGGDEFALLLHADPDPQRHRRRLADLVTRLRAPVLIDGTPVSIGASAGSASAPQDGESVDRLMRVADEAMYEVKRAGTAAALPLPRPRPHTSEVRT